MQQSQTIIESLKAILRAEKITYAHIAKELDLSEATIKKNLSMSHLSLDRLMKICEVANIDLIRLAKIASKHQPALPESVSLSQEQFLASNPRYFVIFILVQKEWTFKKILKHYNFSENFLLKALIALDHQKLIKMFPENKIKRMYSQNIEWHKAGPIRAQFQKEIESDMFAYKFGNQDDRMKFYTWELSPESAIKVCAKIDKYMKELDEYLEIENKGGQENKSGHAILLGFRPWSLSLMKRYKKQN